MFDRLDDVVLGLRSYREVLEGRMMPREWNGLAVVNLAELPEYFRFAGGSTEQQLVAFGMAALLSQPGGIALTNLLRPNYSNSGMQTDAYFLAAGMPGSEESQGIGATVRAIWAESGEVAGFFGSVLQLLPPEGGQRPVDRHGQLRTTVVAGFRMLLPAGMQGVNAEVYGMWEGLGRYWPIGQH